VKLKDFYTNILGLEFVSEEKDRYLFLKAGQSMLLIFNPNKTLASDTSDTQLPAHGAFAPPSIIHFALEINEESYGDARSILNQNNIKIEKEVTLEKDTNSIYFRDPAGNLVEIITPGFWPVKIRSHCSVKSNFAFPRNISGTNLNCLGLFPFSVFRVLKILKEKVTLRKTTHIF
jgi:catechol 2,3-dioxygenase-like lactoylglutathione lyase family enzyme